MHFDNLSKHNILIVGFGREGQSVLRFLEKKNFLKTIYIYDKQPLENFSQAIQKKVKDSNIIFLSDSTYKNHLVKIRVTIKSPGIPLHCSVMKEIDSHNIQTTTPTNIFFEHVKGITIGITGSKGKSTTASFLYEVLSNSGMNTVLCGNIGNPALDYLTENYQAIKSKVENIYFVFEMSSQQLENFTGKCDYAIFTSFFPDHMDYHGDIENYFKAKTSILGVNTKTVFNSEISRLHEYFKLNSQQYLFPYNNEYNKIENDSFFIDKQLVSKTSKTNLCGIHNFKNVLGAITCAKLLGINNKTIQKTLGSFIPLPHRLEKIGIFKDITFINDSSSVTPEATIAALESMKEKIDTLILGGLDRGYNFDSLIKKAKERQIRNIIIFPDSNYSIKKSLKKNDFQPNIYSVITMKKCVEIALDFTQKGEICLLSPGSPSYNLFKNFYERGDLFKKELENQSK